MNFNVHQHVSNMRCTYELRCNQPPEGIGMLLVSSQQFLKIISLLYHFLHINKSCCMQLTEEDPESTHSLLHCHCWGHRLGCQLILSAGFTLNPHFTTVLYKCLCHCCCNSCILHLLIATMCAQSHQPLTI